MSSAPVFNISHSRRPVGDVASPMRFERLDALRLADADHPVEFDGWAFRSDVSGPSRLA